PEDAAVASVEAGTQRGLAVLAERIQTYPDNFTKFAVIGTEDPGLGQPDKTSLAFAVADRPGSLVGALQAFADRDINLTKLESRPRRGAPFEYVFYVDLETAADRDEVAEALGEGRTHTYTIHLVRANTTDPPPG